MICLTKAEFFANVRSQLKNSMTKNLFINLLLLNLLGAHEREFDGL